MKSEARKVGANRDNVLIGKNLCLTLLSVINIELSCSRTVKRVSFSDFEA